MASMTGRIADSARNANELAKQAREAADMVDRDRPIHLRSEAGLLLDAAGNGRKGAQRQVARNWCHRSGPADRGCFPGCGPGFV